AIYVDDNAIPTHVAKQCITDNGCWRSKLSGKHLIKHTLGGLSGLFPGKAEYGNVAIILKRKCQIVKQGIFK
ncbi:MAG TPA: hypothetical protein VN721_00280, partial [Flavipsychrobacter sp.]|nr:hypothetical protein [Flavipsychrobacter sp.]